MRVKVCILAMSVALPSGVSADEAAMLEYLGGQGCAIGPSNIAQIAEAGFEADTIEAVRALGIAEGDWSVLPENVCTIRLPDIQSSLTVADLAPYFTRAEPLEEYADPGCFFDLQIYEESIAQLYDWDADRINQEFLSGIAKGLISGEIRFYTDSPLRTPVSFQLTTGTCGEIPGIEEIRANHPVLVDTFGAYVRESASLIPCERGEILMHMGWPEIIERLSGGQNTSGWISFEMSIIAMGAGWYDGISATEKGTPRPPICHYP